MTLKVLKALAPVVRQEGLEVCKMLLAAEE